MNYFDILLAKKLEDDRDPKVEGLSVTENGRYHEDGVVYDPVIVNVPETPLSKLTVTENGTYTAPSGTAYSEVDVDVPLPSNAYLLKEIEDVEIASFNDGSDLSMPKLEVAIEPVQDLHGYDVPWVGGAGKNLIPMTVADLKSANTSGTWSGNSYVYGGITYTIQTDSGGNVTGINANGTSTSSYSPFYISSQMNVESGKEYIINGSPQSPSSSTWRLWVESSTAFPSGNRLSDDTVGDSRRTAMANETVSVYIQIFSGQILSNKMFYPMIRLAAVSDATFAPYSNICPISGWSEANVSVCGKNIATTEIYKNNYVLAIDGAENYAGGFIITKEIKINNNNNYYISMVGGQTSSSDAIRVGYYDGNLNFIRRESEYSPSLLPMPDNAEYIRLSYRNIDPYYKDIQIEEGTTATTYTPYNGHTYTIDLDGTRYGGTLDVVSGVLTLTDGFIPSYNGETLPSTWISDRDVYAEGTTPTIGAEVCYELATPTTIQLTPTVVKSLRGMNNVFADSGNIIDLSYLAKEE